MGALILDVVSNGNIIGQINITDIGLLCHSRPIKGLVEHTLWHMLKVCLFLLETSGDLAPLAQVWFHKSSVPEKFDWV